jgi:hypothetical protein
MPRKIHWTEDQHATIRRMIEGGQPRSDIARALGVASWTIREYARLHGFSWPVADGGEAAWHGDPHRQPLPPGHDVSWGAITRGSCLEGVRYPS